MRVVAVTSSSFTLLTSHFTGAPLLSIRPSPAVSNSEKAASYLLLTMEELMGLMDSLRRAEEEGKALARRGMEKARNGAEEAERTMRRKMRVHPRSVSAPASVTKNDAPDPAAGGIISIHGRDIDPEELEKKNNAA
jgi:hypothetical protein